MVKPANDAGRLETLKGDWEGMSDHTPVMFEIESQISRADATQYWVPRQRRRDETVRKKSLRIAEEELPRLIEEATKASTGEDVTHIYDEYVKIVREPYIALKKPKPGRYKPFWNHQLDTMAKERKRRYRKAKRTDQPDHWEAHAKIDKQIKQMVNCAKQKRFKEFAEDWSKQKANAQQNIISRISKAKKKLQSKQTVLGRSLNRTELTKYLEEGTRTPAQVEYEKNTFRTHNKMEELLDHSTGRLPNGKTPGVDLIVAEALKAHPKNHAQFPQQLWALCG